jgi:hypothetical protein
LPENSWLTSPDFASTAVEGLVSMRRNPGWVSSTSTTANRSSPSAVASAPPRTCWSTTPRIASRASAETPRISAVPRGSALLLDLGDEALDRAALARLVLEGLTDDAPGQRGRQRTHLGAQLLKCLLAVGLDLRVRGGDDPLGLGLRLLAQLRDDLRALLAGLLTDAPGLVTRLGQLRGIGLQRRLGLRLRLLGLLHPALDGGGPLGERLLEVGDDVLADQEDEDQEDDNAQNDLGDVRDQRVEFFRGQVHVDALVSRGSGQRTNASAIPMIASASASAKPRMAIDCRVPRASGWRRHAVDVGREDQADADTGTDGREAVADHVEGAVEVDGAVHCVSFRWVPRRGGQCSSERAPETYIAVRRVKT